jgi:hypothetical protein
LRSFVDEVYPLLPAQLSPLTKTKTGTQGYLFSIPPKAGRLISDSIGSIVPVDELIAGAIDRMVPDKTARDALVKARIGQGQWRKDLLRQWSGRCAITGLEVESLIRASLDYAFGIIGAVSSIAAAGLWLRASLLPVRDNIDTFIAELQRISRWNAYAAWGAVVAALCAAGVFSRQIGLL